MPVEEAKDVRTTDELIQFVARTVAEIEAPAGSDGPDPAVIAAIQDDISYLFDPFFVDKELKRARNRSLRGAGGVVSYVTDCVERALGRNDAKDPSIPLTNNSTPGFIKELNDGYLDGDKEFPSY
jgi:hypothetical protein